MPTFAPLPHRRLFRAFCIASLCAVTAGCGAGPALPESELFRDASLALEEESYATAISNYKKLLEEYPFSDKAEVASLNIAYAHYLNEEYGEAIAAFNDFERLYPVSPLLPFVSYTIGMCWLDQAKDGDRDATASDEALRQFRKVATEFPNTIYADLSIFRQQQARENLAAHELVVGDYYRQRHRFNAAAGRYRFVISQYPTTESAAHAAERLREVEAMAAATPEAAPAPEAASVPATSAEAKPPSEPAAAVSPATSTPATAAPAAGQNERAGAGS